MGDAKVEYDVSVCLDTDGDFFLENVDKYFGDAYRNYDFCLDNLSNPVGALRFVLLQYKQRYLAIEHNTRYRDVFEDETFPDNLRSLDGRTLAQVMNDFKPGESPDVYFQVWAGNQEFIIEIERVFRVTSKDISNKVEESLANKGLTLKDFTSSREAIAVSAAIIKGG